MPRTVFACPYENCSAMFRHSEKYENHLRKHTGERPFACTFDGCDKRYGRRAHLKRHEETHEKVFKCTIPGCSKILKTIATLQKHQDQYHKKLEKAKKYKCSECSEEFTKHCMLKRHAYIHSGIKAYKCTEPGCNKSFSMQSRLERHIKRHVGYLCEEPDCRQVFLRWTLLRKHKKLCHPKTFRCDDCGKVFKYGCNFKNHLLTHQPEKDIFQCTVPRCVRVYTSKHSLSDHVRTFHATYTIACPEGICHRFFKSEKELETHIQNRHRRRKSKTNPHKKPKPEFAEVLAGFAKGSKRDLNPHLSDTFREGKLKKSDDESEIVSSESERLSHNSTNSVQHLDNKLCLEAQSSQQDLNLPLPPTVSKVNEEKSKEEFVELEVIYHSAQDCLQEDGEQYFNGENYSFSCKPEADQLWVFSDMPTSKVN